MTGQQAWRQHLIRRYEVVGESMTPALEPGDRIVVWRPPAAFWRPRRGDIVLVQWPAESLEMIKRIVGLPGEHIVLNEDAVVINGSNLSEPYLSAAWLNVRSEEWLLGNDQYFVLGDHRTRSADSRRFGPVRLNTILGRAFYRYFPQSRSGWLGQA